MVHLREIRLEQLPARQSERFPWNVPAIRALAGGRLGFDTSVTFLIGENGSGKSTLLEGIACAAHCITVGSSSTSEDPTLALARELGDALRLSWQRRARRGFFMRSEDFFGYVRGQRAMREDLTRELAEIEQEFANSSKQAQGLSRMAHMRELADMRRRYGGDLDGQSHGESYLSLFRERFVPGGLYLLDEPEAPLSPTRQITLLMLLRDLAQTQDTQFIIATHSPILMALPDSAIYSFDGGVIHPIKFNETEHVMVTQAFLANPARFLGRVEAG